MCVATNASCLRRNRTVDGATPVDDPADKDTGSADGVCGHLLEIPKKEGSSATTKSCNCTTTNVSVKIASRSAQNVSTLKLQSSVIKSDFLIDFVSKSALILFSTDEQFGRRAPEACRRNGLPRAGTRPWLQHHDPNDETRSQRSAAFHPECGNHTERGSVRTLNLKSALAPNYTFRSEWA